MSDRSKIEWTDATWNPLRAKNPDTGKLGHHCVKISPACTHCYAASMNKRLGTGLDYSSNSPAEVYLDTEAMHKPLHWKRPRKIFVCSMTDLFLDSYTDEQIAKVFGLMALHPRHTFQVLTKRAERMAAWFQWAAEQHGDMCDPKQLDANNVYQFLSDEQAGEQVSRDDFPALWPLPNVQIGVTAENQECADERIPWLLKTPAAVRFLSCEPLLGPVWIQKDLFSDYDHAAMDDQLLTPLEGFNYRKINWVIVGGESGQHARPMHPHWARSLREQCEFASTPFFFKQWGEWEPWEGAGAPIRSKPESRRINDQGQDITSIPELWCGDENVTDAYVTRVGKKKAGRLLDGREWNEFPQPLERIEA